MEERDVIQLLRFYRHGVLNQLQLFQGYLSMDKTEMAKDKLANFVASLDKEKDLLNTNAPSFALWLLFFNDTYANFRLTYDIAAESFDLGSIDAQLTSQCKCIFHYLSEQAPPSEFYTGHFFLEIEHALDFKAAKGSIELSGDFSEVDVDQVSQIHGVLQFRIKKSKSGMQCTFLLPLQNEVD